LMPENIGNFSAVTASADDHHPLQSESGSFVQGSLELLRGSVSRLAYAISRE
jgi:hypothetical protein